MSKHTPGPLRVCGGHTPAYTEIHSEAGYIVYGMADAQSHYVSGEPIRAPDYETQRANARLIAAAPELLEALKAVQIALAAVRDNKPIPQGTLEELKYLVVDTAIECAEGTE